MGAKQADQFNGDQWHFDSVEFIRDKSNTITGFKVSTGRIRNLKFEKKI